MLNKKEIIRIIEADYDFIKYGEYSENFISGSMGMDDECSYPSLLKEALASPTREASRIARVYVETVEIVVDDDNQFLVKENCSGYSGNEIQWWLLDKDTLKGSLIWEYSDFS